MIDTATGSDQEPDPTDLAERQWIWVSDSAGKTSWEIEGAMNFIQDNLFYLKCDCVELN